jgi:hypothetical protein
MAIIVHGNGVVEATSGIQEDNIKVGGGKSKQR